jgi:hypothetical protein
VASCASYPAYALPRDHLAGRLFLLPMRQTRYIVLVRIGAPARRHGVADADILHAIRNATRHVKMDENLSMLIGPASDGALLELGILDIEGDDPVVIHAMPLRPKFYRLVARRR